MDAAPEPLLTLPILRAALHAAFPGSDIAVEPRLGGQVLKVVVWHFKLELSITTEVMSAGDVEGETTLSLKFGSAPWIVEHTRSKAAVLDFLRRSQERLGGIAATISMAIDQPQAAIPPDIFSGDDHR